MNIFDIVFPNHTCLVCKTEINKSNFPFVCDICTRTLPWHKKTCNICGTEIDERNFVCDRCKENSVNKLLSTKVTNAEKENTQNCVKSCWNFSRARSVFCYRSPIEGLILRLKYNAEGDVAKFSAYALAEVIKANKIKTDFIIPVPLSKKRAKQRGFNQAEILAIELSKILRIPLLNGFLVRIKHTAVQKNMTLKERQLNVHGAFEIASSFSAISAIKGKRVLLVDDVFTTGSTVNECARVLKTANPKTIDVVTIASVGHIPF